MQIYLVGGAVRDEILGLPIKEHDWVVVGSDAQAMLAQGFKQVGKDFPVFLHPKTKEEYALARTERKQGHGYKGFSVATSPTVTLEQDLLRRDLTINAIAKSEHGEIIDPFGGRQDLQNKVLRHVSDAFVEDPLRVLRLARFAAKLPDFSIDKKTHEFCINMVQEGEVTYLTKERVWQEWCKTFELAAPWRFIEVLHQFGAWQILMPACDNIEKSVSKLKKATQHVNDSRLFCVLGLDVSNYQAWLTSLNEMGVPKQVYEIAKVLPAVLKVYEKVHQPDKSILDALYAVDAFRRKDRFIQLIQLIDAVNDNKALKPKWIEIYEALIKIRLNQEVTKKLNGQDIAKWLYNQRLEYILKS